MAKDDYHVIVYYLLSYLYYCLKHGIQPESKYLSLAEYPVKINEEYLAFIYTELLRKGLISGPICGTVSVLGKGAVPVIKSYENTQITSDGIEYLEHNGTMAKVWKAIQESGGLMLQLINTFQ